MPLLHAERLEICKVPSILFSFTRDEGDPGWLQRDRDEQGRIDFTYYVPKTDHHTLLLHNGQATLSDWWMHGWREHQDETRFMLVHEPSLREAATRDDIDVISTVLYKALILWRKPTVKELHDQFVKSWLRVLKLLE